MGSKNTIDFYFDFTSPYAYLASTQIEALAARQDYEVNWQPFLIGATFKITGRKALVEHPLLREYTLKDVQRFARLLGQPLKFPTRFPVLSVKASRLFYFLNDRDGDQIAAKAFAQQVYQAYFVKQQDIMNNAVLESLAEPYGLNAAEVGEAVKSNEMKQRFKQVVDKAIERGVFGAPMFIVDEQMFWGVDRMDQLEKYLAEGIW